MFWSWASDVGSKMSRSHWLPYLCQYIANMVSQSGGAGLSPREPDGTEYSRIKPSVEQLLLRPLRFVLIISLSQNVFRTLLCGKSYPLHYSSGLKTILPSSSTDRRNIMNEYSVYLPTLVSIYITPPSRETRRLGGKLDPLSGRLI